MAKILVFSINGNFYKIKFLPMTHKVKSFKFFNFVEGMCLSGILLCNNFVQIWYIANLVGIYVSDHVHLYLFLASVAEAFRR